MDTSQVEGSLDPVMLTLEHVQTPPAAKIAVTTAGVITAIRRKVSPVGDAYAVLRLDAGIGAPVEVTAFPRNWAATVAVFSPTVGDTVHVLGVLYSRDARPQLLMLQTLTPIDFRQEEGGHPESVRR